MASENELNEYFNHAANVIATAYHHATRDGSVATLGREAIKDVRNTMNEFFFSKGERGGEPGAPLNPLFHDIVEDRKSHETALGGGLAAGKPMTAGQIASEPEEHRGGVHAQQQEQAPVQGNIGQGGEPGRGAPAPAKAGVDGPEKGVHGRDNAAPEHLATAGQVAEDKGLEGQQGQGNVHGQEFAQVPPPPGGGEPAPAKPGVDGPEKGGDGRDNAAPGQIATAGQIAEDKGLEGPQGGDMQVAQNVPTPGGWVEKILNERKGNQDGNTSGDQSFVDRIFTLPGEQRENDKGQGR